LGATNPDEDKANEKKLKRRSDYLNQWIAQTQQYNLTDQEINDQWRADELARLDEWYQLNLDKKEQYEAAKNSIDEKWRGKKSEAEQAEMKRQADTEKRIQQSITDGSVQMAQQSLSLVQMTAEEGSAIQKAAFLASQGLAVGQAIMNAEVAATAALAAPPIGLGPIAGAPLAATIKTQGYMSAAIIGCIIGIESSYCVFFGIF
jgi:hypothetical protein